VTNAKNLKISFQRPANFSAAEMLAGSFAAFEAGKTEKVKIRFDSFAARLVAERQWHKSQIMHALPDGGAELVMQVGIAPDLEAWILGWAGHAEVLEPASLRKKIIASAAEALARYQ
jgi:proteasome accessory factor B